MSIRLLHLGLESPQEPCIMDSVLSVCQSGCQIPPCLLGVRKLMYNVQLIVKCAFEVVRHGYMVDFVMVLRTVKFGNL